MRLLSRLRKDVRRARVAELTRALAEEAGALRFILEELQVEPGPGVVVYGRLETPDGTGAWVGLPTEELIGVHSAHTGASGAGKSMHAIGAILQRARDGSSVTSIDPKGEITGVLARTLPTVTGQPVVVLKPFADPPPPLRLTAPEPGVDPTAQALGLARDLTGLLEDVSLRQQRILVKLCELCIEIGAPLTAIAEWLITPASLTRAGGRSNNLPLRRFAATLGTSESSSTIAALLARLELLFMSPALRQALEAPDCIDFHVGFDTPRAGRLIDLTAPPGHEEAAQILGQLLFGRATRAALGRQVSPNTCDAQLVLDEFPQLVTDAHQRDELGRLLALARFKKISCVLTFQAASMLPKPLLDLVRSCCSIQAVFRQAPDDARALLPAFPPPEANSRRADAKAALLRQLCTLPRRQLALWIRHRGLDPFIARAPRLDLEAFPASRAEVQENTSRPPVAASNALPPETPFISMPGDVPQLPGSESSEFLDLG